MWIFKLGKRYLFVFCNEHFTYHPWIWLKLKSIASTASNRKIAKDQFKYWVFDDPSHIKTPVQVILVSGSSSVSLLMKWGCWGHWVYWGCWGHWGSWCKGNHSVGKVHAVFDFLKPKRLFRSLRSLRLSCRLRSLRPLQFSELPRALKSIS